MIAVFGGRGVFSKFELIPKKMFVFVEHKKDLVGRKFTAVIMLPEWNWSASIDSIHALDFLVQRQPELFKKEQ